MAVRKKELQIVVDFITPYGYHIEKKRHHNHIVDATGRFLISFSNSPSCGHWYKNVIRDLKRYKYC